MGSIYSSKIIIVAAAAATDGPKDGPITAAPPLVPPDVSLYPTGQIRSMDRSFKGWTGRLVDPDGDAIVEYSHVVGDR